MTSTRIGLVVVHWRGMRDTAECLASLSNAGVSPENIVAVVNGPGDFDDAAAQAACPGLGIIHRSDNGGYAAACNEGARRVFAGGAAVVVLLNNDLTVERGAFEALADVFEAHRTAAVAGLPVVYYDEPGRMWSGGGRINRWLGYTRHIGFQAHTVPSESVRVDFVTGAAFAIRREAFELLVGLDERYFHYFEDTDFCERARLAGYETWLASGPAVRHKVSASAGVRGSNRLNRDQAYYFARNRVRFVRRTFRGPWRVVALMAQPKLVAYECLKAIVTGNWPEARGRLEGLVAGLRGRTGPRDRA